MKKKNFELIRYLLVTVVSGLGILTYSPQLLASTNSVMTVETLSQTGQKVMSLIIIAIVILIVLIVIKQLIKKK